MPFNRTTVLWGAAVALNAAGNAAGLIADDAAQTTFIVLAVATVVLFNRGPCGWRGRARA